MSDHLEKGKEMSEVTVSRTRSVLTIMQESKGEVSFGRMVETEPNDEGEMPEEFGHPIVLVDHEKWVELGSPTDITIALWPGDRQDIFDAEIPE